MWWRGISRGRKRGVEKRQEIAIDDANVLKFLITDDEGVGVPNDLANLKNVVVNVMPNLYVDVTVIY